MIFSDVDGHLRGRRLNRELISVLINAQSLDPRLEGRSPNPQLSGSSVRPRNAAAAFRKGRLDTFFFSAAAPLPKVVQAPGR
jgi:hypothetical protein